MGVVNVTPDSFSDGGQWFGAGRGHRARPGPGRAGRRHRRRGRRVHPARGRSGSTRRRSCAGSGPVVTELVRAGLTVSVDTMRARVAESALEAGAQLVNDVSGGLADPDMPRLVAAAGVPYVVMHWRGHSQDMDAARGLRRRGDRGPRRAGQAGGRGGARRGRTRAASCSTRASASASGPSTTGRCWPAWPSWARCASGRSRSWSGRRGRASSASCWPSPDGTPRPLGRPGPGHGGGHRAGRRGRRLVRARARGPAQRGRGPGRGRLAGEPVTARHYAVLSRGEQPRRPAGYPARMRARHQRPAGD